MKNLFNTIQLPKVGSNKFDLSHDVKMSFDMGELVPTACIEALPGDSFEINVQNLLRFAPLVSPVMHKVRVTTHYFFVPTRILWPQWEDFITGNADVIAPLLEANNEFYFKEGGLGDYLGYPTGPFDQTTILSPMPIAAYMKIWDEYYRDQNLQDERFVPLVPSYQGSAYTNVITPANEASDLYKRAWQHDYFTAALPFAQKGDTVQLPLNTGTVPVTATLDGSFPLAVEPTTGGVLPPGDTVMTAGGSGLQADGTTFAINPAGSLEVDIQADAVDINTVRRAFRLQEFFERAARGGTRYIEQIWSNFEQKSSDARLQRPEYIGGSKQNMVISEVLATAETTSAGVSVGTMAGHGISVGGGNAFRYKCEEHGYIIGIINVQPDTAYQQGLHRQFTRFDRLDYAWPTFANIGEQEILNKELYVNATEPDGVFGYIPRYAEYKYLPSRVSGEMRSSLDFWHLGRIFADSPSLNSDFIECNPDTRIFAVEDNVDHIYSHIFNNISVRRKLPRFGTPTI